ncbi:MAG: hypothetical protein VX815_00065 [Gemmatimonadota bacterium]|jgi:hypothetical protein|nr:hypothetical protein [Gemmatimonadota bacterium]
MKRLYWVVGGVIVGTVFTVLFVPGVSEYLSAKVLTWVASAAS